MINLTQEQQNIREQGTNVYKTKTLAIKVEKVLNETYANLRGRVPSWRLHLTNVVGDDILKLNAFVSNLRDYALIIENSNYAKVKVLSTGVHNQLETAANYPLGFISVTIILIDYFINKIKSFDQNTTKNDLISLFDEMEAELTSEPVL